MTIGAKTNSILKSDLSPVARSKSIQLDPSWLNFLAEEFDSEYMKSLRIFLKHQKNAKKQIFPQGKEIFAALNLTPFDSVKVVVLGQDPYHGPGQAHGLSFSVPDGVPIPPSLRNIFKELQTDLKIQAPRDGNLTCWAKQGVLLLNATLTVEMGMAGSHQGKGWELFTDKIVKALNDRKSNLVFILWGSYAQKKAAYVDRSRHQVIESPHPSPLSSHRGFFGSRPFSKTNEYLVSHGIQPIDWGAQ